jgi:hypothetical protein
VSARGAMNKTDLCGGIHARTQVTYRWSRKLLVQAAEYNLRSNSVSESCYDLLLRSIVHLQHRMRCVDIMLICTVRVWL